PDAVAATRRDPAGAGEPRQPLRVRRLAVHADLPGVLHHPRLLRSDHRQHRDLDRAADARRPGHHDPVLPAPDGVDEADADARPGAEGAPEAVQGRPDEAAPGAAGVLPRAWGEPARRLPAHAPSAAAADPD